ncbi:MAG TPA: hypothetical protein PKC57_14990, partial [Microthrixaceae bacterium]|nr:hypothetical protein [Microthrixaceae bacterium]
AAPGDSGVHAVRSEVFGARARAEASLMASGVFRWAARESADASGMTGDEPGSTDPGAGTADR